MNWILNLPGVWHLRYWLTMMPEATGPLRPGEHGWMRVCWKCTPAAIYEFREAGFDTGFSWNAAPLIFFGCDRCGGRGRRYGEILWFPQGWLDQVAREVVTLAEATHTEAKTSASE